MSAIALAQYSLKELIVLTIGGTAFLREIQFLYSLAYIPQCLTQAGINDVTVVHWVVCGAGVGEADKEVHCKGLKTFGGIPIFLAIFGCGTPVLRDDSVEHV